jgi:hypothetical protein
VQEITRLVSLEDSAGSRALSMLQSSSLVLARVVSHAGVLILHLTLVVPEMRGNLYAVGVVTTLMGLLTLLNLIHLCVPPGKETFPCPPCESAGGASKRARSAVAPSQLWYVHGRAYDLTPFLDRHPGGWYALKLGQGRDCTAMFESYHPFTENHRKVLEKHQVSVPESVLAQFVVGYREGGSPPHGEEDAFYDTLKERVGRVLKEKGQDIKASR